MRRRLDYHRKRRAPDGPLEFLRFMGQGEYEVLLTVTAGWTCWYDRTETMNEQDTFLIVQVEETATMQVNPNLPGDAMTTTQALEQAEVMRAGGLLFQIEKEHTRAPLLDPRHWKFRGYYINTSPTA